jgi:hypothetical protein
MERFAGVADYKVVALFLLYNFTSYCEDISLGGTEISTNYWWLDNSESAQKIPAFHQLKKHCGHGRGKYFVE